MRKITNNKGMSKSLYDAIVSISSDYDKVGWMSVTTLIDAPRSKILEQRHADDIIEDASDLIWSFIGSLGHLIAERNASVGAMAEQRFIEEVAGKPISFKPDLLTKDESRPGYWVLDDFKVTSVYVLKDAVNSGKVKKEWERQLNVYSYLLSIVGIKVSKIQLQIIGRDWRQSELMREHNYPPSQFHVQPVRQWDNKEAEQYLIERIELFKACEKLADDELPECTQEQRWADPDRWAICKAGGKVGMQGYKKALPKASKFLSRSEAAQFMAQRKDYADLEIEYRRGESRRCERGYCNAAPFCNQFRETIKPAF